MERPYASWAETNPPLTGEIDLIDYLWLTSSGYTTAVAQRREIAVQTRLKLFEALAKVVDKIAMPGLEDVVIIHGFHFDITPRLAQYSKKATEKLECGVGNPYPQRSGLFYDFLLYFLLNELPCDRQETLFQSVTLPPRTSPRAHEIFKKIRPQLNEQELESLRQRFSAFKASEEPKYQYWLKYEKNYRSTSDAETLEDLEKNGGFHFGGYTLKGREGFQEAKHHIYHAFLYFDPARG